MTLTDERLEFAARLNRALDKAGIPPKHYGRQQAVVALLQKHFRISQVAVRKWLEGEALPATKKIPVVAAELGVYGEWLLSGRGPMCPEDGPTPWETLVDTNQVAPGARGPLERWARALKNGEISEERFRSLTAAILADTKD